MSAVTPVAAGRGRLLVVDDNPAALYATARVLRSAGYEVLEVSTGTAALTAAEKVDLVVLDINLPDIDGFEVCRRLRAQPRTAAVPVLHLSASFTDASDLSVGLAAGADSYLTRPVEPPVLIAAVRTLLFARQADLVRRGADAKLRTMFNLAPIGMAILDANFCYDSVNPAFCALTGYAQSELALRTWTDPISTAGSELINAMRAQIAREGRWEGQLGLRRKDGSTVEVECQISEEKISGAHIVVAIDVTQRRQAETERESLLASERAARAEAERSSRLKEEFLATLSHELRNPISAIMGWSTVIGRLGGLPAVVTQGVQAIERNSKLQAQMIADLLDYASITYGKMRLVAAIIDPYPVVRAALEVVQLAAQTQGVTITAEFDDAGIYVDADASRLQQVVWNLLSNAIKFTPKGGQVLLSAKHVDGSLQLIVQDNGKGIAREFLPRIFERFSQQDSTSTRSQGGLGLGLALVKQLVDLHGGSIQAFSTGSGHGATFTVLLPVSDKTPVETLSESQYLRSLNLDGVTALVVEDDTDTRELITRILSDAGANVVEAASAEAALECMQSSGANVLISDIGMADQNGYELLRKLRARGFGAEVLPAMALTAFARMQDRVEALSAGFQDHLVKPFEPQILISRIAALRRNASIRASARS